MPSARGELAFGAAAQAGCCLRHLQKLHRLNTVPEQRRRALRYPGRPPVVCLCLDQLADGRKVTLFYQLAPVKLSKGLLHDDESDKEQDQDNNDDPVFHTGLL
mgnify:CR=1 FL=1